MNRVFPENDDGIVIHKIIGPAYRTQGKADDEQQDRQTAIQFRELCSMLLALYCFQFVIPLFKQSKLI